MKVRNMEQRYWLTACHWFGCCQCETPSRDDTARLSVLWVRQRALPYLPTHKSPQRHAQVRNFFTHHNANICGYILVLIMSSNWTTWKSSLYVLRVTSNTRSRRASGSEYFPPWHQQETAVDYWSIWRHSQRMNLVRLRDISAESIGSTSESEETCLWLTLRAAVNISSSSWITWFIIPMIKTEYKKRLTGYDNRGGTYTQRAFWIQSFDNLFKRKSTPSPRSPIFSSCACNDWHTSWVYRCLPFHLKNWSKLNDHHWLRTSFSRCHPISNKCSYM